MYDVPTTDFSNGLSVILKRLLLNNTVIAGKFYLNSKLFFKCMPLSTNNHCNL